MHPARDWQQIKQQMALELAGSAEGDQALADSKKFGALADEIESLRRAAQAVVDRWDSPLWKDQPHTGNYISDLREALKETK
jgi:hypothetical protein